MQYPSTPLKIALDYQQYDPAFPVICAERQTKEHGQVTHLHHHNGLEIGICHEGDGIFFFNNTVVPYQKGCVTFFTPDDLHFSQSRKGVKSLWTWIYFDPERLLLPFHEDLPQMLAGPIGRGRSTPFISEKEDAPSARMVETIIAELRARPPLFRSTVRALLYLVLAGLVREIDTAAGKRGMPSDHAQRHALLSRINPALTLVGEKYADKIVIADLAKLCCMSEVHFGRVFKKAVGRTPLDYIMDVRIGMALSYLRGADKPVSWIAAATGFPSISSFNRKFREQTGESPLRWRKQT